MPEDVPMTDAVVDDLVLDLLEWVGPTSRPYTEVMEAWRTSCPRLPVWETANERGFIERHHEPGRGALVAVSTCGRDHLHQHRSPPDS
jgi:D-3-phosphoglycerate dehydrogenase